MSWHQFLTGEVGLRIAREAERRGVWPSSLIGTLPPITALALDIALAVRLLRLSR